MPTVTVTYVNRHGITIKQTYKATNKGLKRYPYPLPPRQRRSGQPALIAGEWDICETCGEYLPLTRHHLIPKSKGGTKTCGLCVPCHTTVHAEFGLDCFQGVGELRDALICCRLLPWRI